MTVVALVLITTQSFLSPQKGGTQHRLQHVKHITFTLCTLKYKKPIVPSVHKASGGKEGCLPDNPHKGAPSRWENPAE